MIDGDIIDYERRNKHMLTVTNKAIDFLMNLMEKLEGDQKVRIFLDESAGNHVLGMILDQTRDGDEVIVVQGIPFLIARELYERSKPIEIDFIEYTPGAGFKISSSLEGEKLPS